MIVYNNEYNLILKHLLIRLPALYGAQLKTRHPRILTEIINNLGILTPITADTLLAYIDGCTNDFIPSYKFNFKIYWVLKELQAFPTCRNGHPIEPKSSFRVRVDPITLEVTSNLASYCNNPQCCQTDPNVRQRYIHTCQARYGYDNTFQVPEKKAKITATNIQRLGVPVPAKNPQILAKMEQTCLNRYGVKNIFQLQSVIDKIHTPEIIKKKIATLNATMQQRFGVNWYVQSDEFLEKVNATAGKSKEEQALVNFIETICSYEVIVGSFKIISPKQLDAYIPSLKLAFEFNGTFYHSIEHNSDKFVHLNKTKRCEDLGIKLVHIWEDEWYFKKTKCKNQIKSHIASDIPMLMHDCIELASTIIAFDRAKYNRCIVSTFPKLLILAETEPAIILRAKKDKTKYKVADCGVLICIKIPTCLELKN